MSAGQTPEPLLQTGGSQEPDAGRFQTSPERVRDEGLITGGVVGSWLLVLLFPLSLILDAIISSQLSSRQMRRLHIWLLPWVVIPLLTILSSALGYVFGKARMISTFYTPVMATTGDIHTATHCRVSSFQACIPPPPCTLLHDIPANGVATLLASVFGPMHGTVPGRLPDPGECATSLEQAVEQPDLATALIAAGGPAWLTTDPGLLAELRHYEVLYAPSLYRYDAPEDCPARAVVIDQDLLVVGQPAYYMGSFVEYQPGEMVVSLLNLETKDLITQFIARSTVWDAALVQAANPCGWTPADEMVWQPVNEMDQAKLDQFLSERGLELPEQPVNQGLVLEDEASLSLLKQAQSFSTADEALAWAHHEYGLKRQRLGFSENLILLEQSDAFGNRLLYRPQFKAQWRAALADGVLVLYVACERSADKGWSYDPQEGALLVNQLELPGGFINRRFILSTE